MNNYAGKNELRDFLFEKAHHYEARWFIDDDPIQIPHLFSQKEDIEIAGFLTATLAWGKRTMILSACRQLMERMDMAPYDFIGGASHAEMAAMDGFVYRTFQNVDLVYFLKALRNIYTDYGGLHNVFFKGYSNGGVIEGLRCFREVFLSFGAPQRTGKHVANVAKQASAKRLNMFLRWMVRRPSPVDFGLWTNVEPADLLIPLDLHVARVARSLGILNRKQNDLKAVLELTNHLSEMRPEDPVSFDYALFGLGVYEKF
ncbi:TIGR02757 family protein [Marinilabilia rubra]|uniref:TIGR02757 family protein n=1 Tax=Marinilabilia rubra TaxID=2162893 RepID=A0A2U2B9Z0_9BACT|nr:TIGR02757 family protein [Marinilabilia rubra]PWD99864.1 TIGR02757 family protein [Marinilabilia rubra]